MPADPPSQPETRRLDHLPIIGQALRTLRIRELVNERVVDDERSKVTTGECVEALIVAILLGKHTLYRIDELLAPFDLELAFDWRCDPVHFNDTRLGKALVDLWRAGPAAIHAAAVVTAVESYQLDLSRLHFDTSTASVYGDYALSHEPEDPEEPEAVPHLTYGHSKDHRPDLKQILIGLTVTSDGPVPVMGRAASGNRADGLEAEFSLRQLASTLPDPRDVVLAADSKFFSGRRLELCEFMDLAYVTLVPRNVGVWREAFDEFCQRRAGSEELPVLKRKERRASEHDPKDGPEDVAQRDNAPEEAQTTGAEGEPQDEAETEEAEDVERFDEWRGLSFDLVYEWDDKEQGRTVPIPVRLLVVESSALRRRKSGSLERSRDAEAKRIDRKVKRILKRDFHCAEDAEAELQLLRKVPLRFHTLEASVGWEEVPVKRSGRGRPKKDEPHRYQRRWRVDVDVCVDPAAFEQVLLEESCFVLSTNVPRAGRRAQRDAELLEFYDEQHTVEGCLRWAKRPLAVAPIFLKNDDRVAALVAVYVLALMVYGLVQRQIRRLLRAEGTTMPGNRGQGWTDTPTTEVLFRLFEGIFTLRGHTLEDEILVTGMNTEQVRILRLLRSPMLHQPRVRIAQPRTPKPGERACRPQPRAREMM